MKDIREKISKGLLFLLLLVIPTQLGKHFWFDWSLILGIRIDYLSPTFYLVDLIWIAFFILEISTTKFQVFQTNHKKQLPKFKTLFFIAFVLVNILVAKGKWMAIYKWIRIGQLVWFGYFVSQNKKIVEKMLIWVLPFWIGVESLLAIGQIAKGGSLNGFWWWLGERSFDFNTIGIAQMSVINNGIVRAYGTFSHPNSLAGFLLVSLVLWVKYKSSPNPFFDKTGLYFRNICWWGVMWSGIMGIILTGSRTIWVLSVVSLVWLMRNKIKNIKNKGKIIIMFLVLIGLVYKMIDNNYPIENFLSGWDENGLLKRGQLNLAALKMIKDYPLVGVGLGNFLVNLPDYQKNNQIFWFQPVHNIILLLISEIGLLGVIIFSFQFFRQRRTSFHFAFFNKIKNLIKNNDKIILLILGIIFLSGMVDHYWFTLPQNMWLLALILGII